VAIRTEWQIALDGRVMLNDPDLVVRAAVDGLGIAYTIEALADPFLGRVVKLVEMPTAGISDGQVAGLSGLLK
jgi:DNA-binding transcriptional LysR family regulator